MTDESNEQAVVDRLRAGDARAMEDLVIRWGPRLHGFLTRHVGDPLTAQDLCQECFVIAWRKRARLRPGVRFSTWLFGIAANVARQRRRWLARHPELPLEDWEGGATPRDPARETLQSERVAAVHAAIVGLPMSLRTPLLLAEYENLSHAEIAAILQTTPKSVERRIARARERLRKSLAAWL